MSPAEIAEALRVAREARERADGATVGPWVRWPEHPAIYANVRERPTAASIAGYSVATCEEEALADLLEDEEIGQGFGEHAAEVQAGLNASFIAAARSDVPALATLVERMAGELARLPSAERIAEIRAAVEDALDEEAVGHFDPKELLRLLAEDLADVLDAIAPLDHRQDPCISPHG